MILLIPKNICSFIESDRGHQRTRGIQTKLWYVRTKQIKKTAINFVNHFNVNESNWFCHEYNFQAFGFLVMKFVCFQPFVRRWHRNAYNLNWYWMGLNVKWAIRPVLTDGIDEISQNNHYYAICVCVCIVLMIRKWHRPINKHCLI